jgi:hypothetical protein
MDALDEFFREWCEPEAWCERCGENPAIHVAVQDTGNLGGSLITYMRVWDPGCQEYLAICRTCSKQHIDALGSQEFQYATPTPHAPLPDQQQRRSWHKRWWQRFQRWHRRFRILLVQLWKRRQSPPEQANTQPHFHTETQS